MTRLHLSITCSLAVSAIAGCSSSSTYTAATLNAPGGLAVAGSNGDLLFIANANENALQVAKLDSTLTALEFKRGPALHFPLRVLAGPQPEAIAATPNGRYVVVLNGSGETLRLIDADALVPASNPAPTSTNGSRREAVVTLAGPPGSAPADLVAAAPGVATACAAPCVGRFFVSLSGVGAVAAFEVQESDGLVALVPTRTYDVRGAAGATPVSLAVHPDGGLLFVTDTTNNQVIRVDLASGVVLDRLAVGDAPGPIVVSADGTALVVGRPRLRDLVVFDALTSAAPRAVDANTALAPPLSCLNECSKAPACVGEHEAEAAVCTDPTVGFVATSTAYRALYLPGVPLRLLAIGSDPSSNARRLKVTCLDGSDQPVTYSDQWVMVALSNGQLVYVSLRSHGETEVSPQDDLAPTLVSTRPLSCLPPTLVKTAKTSRTDIAAPPLADYLRPCPGAPSGRNRFACATACPDDASTCTRDPASAATSPGVVIFPGQSGTQVWTFEWEGTVVQHAAGGKFAQQDVFYDDTNDLSASGIGAGDILQVTTAVRSSEACSNSLAGAPPANRSCLLEWVIESAGLNPETNRYELTLEHRVPMAAFECWPQDGSIGYRIRAGNAKGGGAYWVSLNGSAMGRAYPRPSADSAPWGTLVGPGGAIGARASALFAVSIPPEVALPSGDSCVDYDLAGTFITESARQRQLFSRGNPFGFTVSDRFGAYLATYTTANTGSALAGTLPSDMKLVQLPPAGTGKWAVFVSFGASNSILGLFPFDTQTVATEGNSIVLR